jgi:acyl-CoA synthetase (AMP-forming)/AMP-acid ligase II
VDELGPILEIARPGTLRRLWRAGAIRARSAAGLAGSLPWLVGRGPSLGILSRLNAMALGATPAIVDRHGVITWADLDRRSNQVAHALVAAGLRGGDRVATLLRNGREQVEVILATQKLGMAACPLSTWARPGEVAPALERADPDLLVYDGRHADQLGDVGSLPRWAVGEPMGPLPGSEPYESLLAIQPVSAPGPFTRRRGRPRIVIHTSGTTGRPKGAARDATGRGMREFAGFLQVVPLRREDRILIPAPLFHSFGLLTFTLGALLGTTVVLPDRFDPEETLDLTERYGVTAWALVPVMVRRILDLPQRPRERARLSSLRIALLSGSALSEDLRREAAERLGPTLYDLYGSTEAGWVAVASPQDMESHPGTVGRPVPGVEVAVLDPDGEPLSPGETGELHVRSDAMFEGYVTGDDDVRRNGFLSLGDLGFVDEEGYLHVTGRKDDMVVVGGENVFPAEVEEVIRRLDGVDDVAVFGVDDPEYGQALAAAVVGEADPERIRQACRGSVSSFKIPRRIERVKELPRTSTGKVLTRELAEKIGSGNRPRSTGVERGEGPSEEET